MHPPSFIFVLEAPETSYSMPLIIMQKSTKAITFKYWKKKKIISRSSLIHSGNVFSVRFERIRQIFKRKGSKHGNLEKVLSY